MKNRKIMIAGLMAVTVGMAFAGCGKESGTQGGTRQETVAEESTDYEDTDDYTDEETDTEDEDDGMETQDTGDDTEGDAAEFSLPVQEDFTLAEGLSEKYADLDNRSFVYNGKKFTVGESTLKDLIDGGIPFESSDLNNSGNNVNQNYETERYTARINDYVTMQFMFGNFTDSEQKAEDCVLTYVRYSHLYDPQPDYDADMNAEITEAMLDAAKQVHFSFPATLTKEQLLANSSDSTEDNDNYVKYLVDSEVYMGSSGYQFQFDKNTYQLKEVSITYLP